MLEITKFGGETAILPQFIHCNLSAIDGYNDRWSVKIGKKFKNPVREVLEKKSTGKKQDVLMKKIKTKVTFESFAGFQLSLISSYFLLAPLSGNVILKADIFTTYLKWHLNLVFYCYFERYKKDCRRCLFHFLYNIGYFLVVFMNMTSTWSLGKVF